MVTLKWISDPASICHLEIVERQLSIIKTLKSCALQGETFLLWGYFCGESG